MSGPLLDRIDLHIHVPAVPPHQLAQRRGGESTREMGNRVAEARAAQRNRVRDEGCGVVNGQLGPREIRRWCTPRPNAGRLLRDAVRGFGLSARAYHRILKVARTVADLGGSESVDVDHVAEAVQYRTLDRSFGRLI